MKNILLALSFLSLFLISCGGNNDGETKSNKYNSNEQEKKEEQKNIEEDKYKKAATDIVYKLAEYKFKDDLNKNASENIDTDSLEKLNENFKKYSEKTETSIKNIAKLLGEKPLSSDLSESIINKYVDSIDYCKTELKINTLYNNITTELVKNKPSREEEEEYKAFKEDLIKIKTDLTKKIKEESNKNDSVVSTSTHTPIETPIKFSLPTWLYAILVTLIVLLAAAIYFIKNIYDSLERFKIKRDSDKQKFNDLKYNHDRLTNKVAVIDIDAVRNEMYEQLNVLAGRINDTQSERVHNVRSTPQAKPEPKIFYAQYPDSADPVGFKNIQFESNSKMVYRITRIEGNKARFIIQPDENTQQYAIGNHGKILKPVCEYLNQPSSLNRTIKVFREGRLEMQNNIWIVVEKLKIKFE